VSGDLWPCDRLLGVQAVPTIAVPARTARRRPKRLRVYQSTPGRSLSEGLHSPFAPAQYFKARRHCATPTPEEAIERFVGIVDAEVGLCMAEILDKQLQRVTSSQVFCFGVADRLPRFTADLVPHSRPALEQGNRIAMSTSDNSGFRKWLTQVAAPGVRHSNYSVGVNILARTRKNHANNADPIKTEANTDNAIAAIFGMSKDHSRRIIRPAIAPMTIQADPTKMRMAENLIKKTTPFGSATGMISSANNNAFGLRSVVIKTSRNETAESLPRNVSRQSFAAIVRR
jgi:hypothetical protein